MSKWLALFFLIPTILYAKEWSTQGPFEIRTQNPVYLQSVNLDPARATTLQPGVLEVRIDSAFSNLYERDFSSTADENLDMELWRLNFVTTYGFYPDFEAGVAVPVLHFGGGFLDGFIQDYHNFFGFPNGGRNLVANGVFNYRVSKDGQVVYRVSTPEIGLGDISFFIKHKVLNEGALVPSMAWRFTFKIPSGNPIDGMGSGSPGFGLGLAFEKSYKRLHGYLNTNYLVDGGNDKLDGLMRNTMFDFSLAGEFSLSKRVSAILQLAGGTPRLKGLGLQTWDGVPLDLIVGVRGDQPWGKPLNPFFWQVAFSEDVLADGPSVDFTAWISVGFRFQAHKLNIYQGDFFARR